MFGLQKIILCSRNGRIIKFGVQLSETDPNPCFIINFGNDPSYFGEPGADGHTIFLNTNFTPLVALCARLIHSAMKSREISIIVAPTEKPVLLVMI